MKERFEDKEPHWVLVFAPIAVAFLMLGYVLGDIIHYPAIPQ